MATQFERFKGTLEKMLMLDQADLDFGIYRIMNQKRADIEKYLNNELKQQVEEAVSGSSTTEVESLKAELAYLIETLTDAGIDPETSPKVKDLRAKLSESSDTESLENEVYSHLTTFFSRYYDDGDFISQRRYKKDVYAIPYEGEEVKLHWANADQYYIKTGEYFRSYRFTLTSGKAVEFTLKEATVEQNNNLAQNNMERRFALCEEQPVEVDGNTLHINFTYELYPKDKKQKEFVDKAYDTVKGLIPSEFIGVFGLRPTDKDRSRTLLQKHMNDYVARNTFDYFIHKDLSGFLSRELDFFIKNEILVIDDIDAQNPKDFVQHLSVIKAIKTVGKKIITFLASLEDFQKKLWLKKKFVVQADYCITLDRVPEELYSEICANDKQREEWVKLFAIDEIKKDGMFGVDYTNPLTIDFLKANPFLVLDTAFFSSNFKNQLLSKIDNIDEQCDGILINSDNFHALGLIQEKYKKQIKCSYIDPPYNAQSSEILYKNTFKHSSWLSMMDNRLMLGGLTLKDEGVQIVAIDEVEQERLGQLLTKVFPSHVKDCITVIHNPSGQQGDNFSFTNEFAFFVYPQGGRYIGEEIRTENVDTRGLRAVTGEDSQRESAANCFYPIFVKESKIVGFGDVCPDDFHPNMNEDMGDGIIAIYPIDPQGVERKWRFARQTVESIKDELFPKFLNQRKVWDIQRNKNKFNFKSVWTDKKYFANNYGTQPLNQMFGKQVFTFPKSIHTVMDCISAGLNGATQSVILDYFAGSGTTGHAVINLNREDGGNRKYILCEMGDYFNTVTKPRIQKVIYSKDWKDGKPVSREGISHCFKYMRLEQYEDTLNNLVVKSTMSADGSGEFYDGYMLGYLLDTETKDSLFNLEWFRNPWNTKLFITRQNETKEENIDLIETFNYLIGLNVETILYPKEGICTVEGVTRSGERTLVIWRNVDMIDNEALNKFFEKQAYSTKDFEFDRIYVNGDCNLENLRTDEENWKVVLTEKEFAKRMFEDC